ncbi:DNA polymerase III gamma/tau subunits-like protein [Leadbetterella byssophila DSM 17132]|uniref:DNA polymerase III gamma/tau subunits-like protein n=1 Tax=Leadbetterella byssophila (strain DSM 17132 / JCM 16389 / KACC 11308 / NBRC 106382 / 4M15) TaxID=649349 RepID=E4RTY3_LEAB4|nr:DNA polymerase III subunit delta [Leadbetterella byssophila]ADQ18691.1 DNA polymerase III gamma/tau subunits-like protein [Leadbetterella byssophila DSM 17132]
MKFSDIPGLEETKGRLKDAVRTGHLAHALLFDGKPGGAALPMALALATYVNCEQSGGEDACGQCPACSKYDKLIHPDLTFTFPTAGGKKVLSENFLGEWRNFVKEDPYGTYTDWLNYIGIKQGNIPVEESRQIIQNLSLKSYEGGYKIVLIWNVESMAAPAANALLKILEEPPAKTLFLLVTSDYNRLLATIQSRVQRVAVRDLNEEEMVDYLTQYRQIDPERAKRIAFLSEGNLSDALSRLGREESEHKEWFANWMRYCYVFDIAKIVPTCDQFDEFSKEEQKGVLEYGLKILREIYLENVGLSSMVKLENEELVFVQKFSKVFNFANIGKISEAISDAILHIERNVRAKIVFLDLSMIMATLIKK